MDPIRVVVTRGSFVESVHLVHAVAVQDGAVAAEAGDPSLLTSLRSSAKPFQALPLVRSRDDLDDRDVAIASASHRAEPEQIEAVRALLAKAGASEADLDCGLQDGRPPEPLYHNCSGKHAGMLATCRARGWDRSGYRNADHPLQRELLSTVAAAAEMEAREIETAVDGCGVVAFALPLERAAFMFSRLAEQDGGTRVVAAMRGHPQLIGGRDTTDTVLMKALPGWIAKGGAEGLLCAAGPDGLGVALKAADGTHRALGPAAASFLGRLGHTVGGSLPRTPVLNSHGERVGEIVAAL
jgi:L-asparaginase II